MFLNLLYFWNMIPQIEKRYVGIIVFQFEEIDIDIE